MHDDMPRAEQIPAVPLPLSLALRCAPLAPLRIACDRLVKDLARRRPGLFDRLGEHVQKSVTLDPTDLPIAFRLTPDPARPRLEVMRGESVLGDARIAGSLAALIGLVHGAYDGDALFFSRDLVIEGDTAFVLALRNAIDNEEINLADEAAALFGPLSRLAAGPLNRIAEFAGRLTGVALTRHRAFGGLA